MLGYKIETFIAAYAGSDQRPDLHDWFRWLEPETADSAHAGPGTASEEEIRDAWGGAYETMRAESDAGE